MLNKDYPQLFVYKKYRGEVEKMKCYINAFEGLKCPMLPNREKGRKKQIQIMVI